MSIFKFDICVPCTLLPPINPYLSSKTLIYHQKTIILSFYQHLNELSSTFVYNSTLNLGIIGLQTRSTHGIRLLLQPQAHHDRLDHLRDRIARHADYFVWLDDATYADALDLPTRTFRVDIDESAIQQACDEVSDGHHN